MTLISAANNLSIDLSAGGWRLCFAGNQDVPLAEATAEGFIYNSVFARARCLPTEGMPTTMIEQVVLGWQKSDESWHLGLLLRPPIAEPRGSRWCELARWPDPDQTLFVEQAQEAGERVALLLDVPYQFIRPEPLAPPPPPRPLPALPLALGGWQLTDTGTYVGQTLRAGQLALARSPQWRRAVGRRWLSRLFWSAVYFAVSVLTLTSDINLPNAGTLIPNPHLLPYLGLLVSVGLLLYGAYERWRANVDVSLIVCDAHSAKGFNQAGILWEVSTSDAQSLYVSEVFKNARKRIVEYGELNAHLGGGIFHRLMRQETMMAHHVSQPPTDWQPPAGEHVVPLTRANYATDLQAAALYLGEKMGLPVWLDCRRSGLFDQFLRMR
jgi:hypothetical protein